MKLKKYKQWHREQGSEAKKIITATSVHALISMSYTERIVAKGTFIPSGIRVCQNLKDMTTENFVIFYMKKSHIDCNNCLKGSFLNTGRSLRTGTNCFFEERYIREFYTSIFDIISDKEFQTLWKCEKNIYEVFCKKNYLWYFLYMFFLKKARDGSIAPNPSLKKTFFRAQERTFAPLGSSVGDITFSRCTWVHS